MYNKKLQLLTDIIPNQFETKQVEKGWKFDEIITTEWFLFDVNFFIVQNTLQWKKLREMFILLSENIIHPLRYLSVDYTGT